MCQRMSAADPKYLTEVSTEKTKVIKLYTNQRIREVRPVNKAEDPNSLRRGMSFFMLMAQCFALCPVQGITGLTVQHLRYFLLSLLGLKFCITRIMRHKVKKGKLISIINKCII